MRNNCLTRLAKKTISITPYIFLGMVLASPALAGAGTDATQAVSGLSAQDMLNRIADQMPSLMRMVTAIAYVLGMYFIFVSMLKFKRFGEMRTMMSMQHHLSEPLTFLFVGAMLLYLPTSVQVGMSTFWSSPNPYGYELQTDQWSLFLRNCYLVVQLFGTIALIRGLVIIASVAGKGGGQGGMGKGLTHIVGGIFCINIYQFVKVILWTLGIETA